nr:PREDICTED: cucumisin-like [Daucus carota subsp. sativus]
MGDRLKADLHGPSIHRNMLEQVLGSNASSSLLHSYTRSFNGFVVKLSSEEMLQVAAMNGVVSVFPNRKKQLHTTRTWDFMGFPQEADRTNTGSDVIIGVFDTGIWPESDSFDDTGFGLPPVTWKGICQTSNITCNNKIVGARYYKSDGVYGPQDFVSPRDSEGHGTHVASTAAGGVVNTAGLIGLAAGTARGAVPSARLAIYKVCWSAICEDADILAAFDDAIEDGVNIISISAGGEPSLNYFNDSIAIGSFHAMKHGILTSTSAGNDGPDLGTISNYSPWHLSVAASTIDRKFFTKLKLGNNKVYQGVSVNTFDMKNVTYPIIYGGNAPNVTGGFNGSSSRYCETDSLDSTLVKGKILLCDVLNDGEPALQAGAAGIVMQGDEPAKDFAVSFPLPATFLSADDGLNVFNYINRTSNPIGTILKSNEENDTFAPYVASFSSRGPNPVTFDILKPDIAAPGVDILAAWSSVSPVSRVKSDQRRVPYNIISGTSMACPHATGVAAYIKSFHPSWSPAAIKSAIITTGSAFPMNATTSLDNEFGYGAGHINPARAINPGLVYDAGEIDYVKFLCAQGYSNKHLQIVTGDNSTCSEATNGTVWDLNLPSFALAASLPARYVNQTFQRTVMNVGSPGCTYKGTVTGSSTLNIQSEPSVLSFTHIGQKLSFVVKIEGRLIESIVSASLVWDDGLHQVRSPIVVYATS